MQIQGPKLDPLLPALHTWHTWLSPDRGKYAKYRKVGILHLSFRILRNERWRMQNTKFDF